MGVPKGWNKALGEEITAALKRGEEVNLNGVGKLVPKRKPARMSRNPQTGAQVQVPERNAVVFKLSSTLKTAVNS